MCMTRLCKMTCKNILSDLSGLTVGMYEDGFKTQKVSLHLHRNTTLQIKMSGTRSHICGTFICKYIMQVSKEYTQNKITHTRKNKTMKRNENVNIKGMMIQVYNSRSLNKQTDL